MLLPTVWILIEFVSRLGSVWIVESVLPASKVVGEMWNYRSAGRGIDNGVLLVNMTVG